jgi:acetyltransferase-like isoleucine patch superfamily enzyme
MENFLTTLVWTLREELGRTRARLLFNRYRLQMRARGVVIQRDANICGGPAIQFGEGTVVYNGVIVSAGYLKPQEDLSTSPLGSIRIGRRCTMLPNTILATCGGNITIGDDVSMNPGVVIYGDGNVIIGDKTRIATQVTIIAAMHVYSDSTRPMMEQGLTKKGIVIGRDVWIGSGAKILDGVTIGDCAVVAAGSVVQGDVAPCMVVAGIPARAFSMRRPHHNISAATADRSHAA